jgi:hypothetical protein
MHEEEPHMVPHNGPPVTTQILVTREELFSFMEEYMSTRSNMSSHSTPTPMPTVQEETADAQANPRRIPEIPTLLRTTDLPSHIAIFETLFQEERIQTDSMRAKVAFARSVQQFPKVQDMVYNLIELPFDRIKDNLIRCFANVVVIRSELDQKIKSLVFNRDTICNDIRALYQFYIKANGLSPIPESTFVNDCFAVIPAGYKADLIRLAHTRYPGRLWATISTFELCDLLEEICFIRNQIEAAMPSTAPRAPLHGRDKVKRIQSQSQPHSWLESLAAKYHSVFYINQFEPEQLQQILQSTTESFQLKRRDGTAYYVVAFADSESEDVLLRTLPAEAYRQFQKQQPPKNL